MLRHKIVVLLFLYMQVMPVCAQQPYAINYTVLQGLPSNAVYQLFQDKDNFIWIANDNGLCRFDGSEFVNYTARNMSSTAGSNLQEDTKGRIWFQNFDGYCFYTDNDSLKILDDQSPQGFFHYGLIGDYIFTIHQSGVWVYDIHTLKLVNEIPLSFDNLIYTLAARGSYYLIDNKDLIIIDRQFNIKRIKSLLPQNVDVVTMYTAGNKIFIVPKYNQNKCIYELTADNKLIAKFNNDAAFIQGMTMVDNAAWLLTPNGIQIVTNKGQRVMYAESSISSVLFDHQNNLWISTTSEGIKLVPDMTTRFRQVNDYVLTRIINTGKNYVLFTNKEDILTLSYDLKTLNKVVGSNNGASIYYAYYDSSSGRSFVSSYGFRIYTDNTFSKSENFKFAVKQIQRLDDKYYVFASSGLVGLYRHGRVQRYSVWDSIAGVPNPDGFQTILQGVRAKSLAIDYYSNRVYVSTNKGLYVITPSGYTPYLVNNDVFYAVKLFYASNTLVALTADGKLWNIANPNAPVIINSTSASLPNNIKMAVQFNSVLCVAGDEQICTFKLGVPDADITNLPLRLNVNDIADILVHADQVVVLTHLGVVTVPVQTANQVNAAKFFRLNKFIVNGQSYNSNVPSVLEYYQNNIRIAFSILDYSSPTKHKIEYSISDDVWSAVPSGSYMLDLVSLAPGNYTISFRINGELAAESLQFIINKPFWITWWFITLLILLSLLIILAVYKWQVNLIVNKNKLITERYELENELNKSVLTSIRSQMNPHFFYNALNTIQSYIFNNDKKNASNYLAKFSKLTRNILEMSDKELIKLSDEISSLQLYLDLEKMRFEDELQYSVVLENDLDIELIKIPPMLIQPYVENAIKHGLLHVRGEKKLTIRFSVEKQGILRVVVDDNGIGRKRSEQLNRIRSDKHQSFSTNANARRLEILNKGKLQSVGIQIIDKYSESTLPLGTQVILDIPYN
jgi:ligand-binding sensor domain-containing protein/two-component sensor histidine kinase